MARSSRRAGRSTRRTAGTGWRWPPSGNVIEWDDGIVVMWKTDTEGTGKANYLTLLPGGKLVVCKGDGTEVKAVPNTEGRGGTKLVLQDDAQLVLLRDDDSTAWRTGLVIGVTWGAIRQ
jgi:hypothetical protein